MSGAGAFAARPKIRLVRARSILGLAALSAILVAGAAHASLPPPRFGHSVDIGLVSGTVIISPPGAPSFKLGPQDRNIPVGSLIDTKHGRVDLRAAPPPAVRGAGHASAVAARVQDAQFYDGAFRVTQSASNPLAQIKLARGGFGACKAPSVHLGRQAKLPHKLVRLLWASGSGRFRTVGRYSAATVLGTKWLTEDFCDGTLVRVSRGVVAVENLATHTTVTVRAGQSAFTPAA